MDIVKFHPEWCSGGEAGHSVRVPQGDKQGYCNCFPGLAVPTLAQSPIRCQCYDDFNDGLDNWWVANSGIGWLRTENIRRLVTEGTHIFDRWKSLYRFRVLC